MKGKFSLFVLAAVVASLSLYGVSAHAAGEHGGKEHAGSEHGGTAVEGSHDHAKEHGGQEHGGQEKTSQEHGGQEHAGAYVEGSHMIEPTAEQLRQAIRDYVAEMEGAQGAFTIEHEVTGGSRTLTLEQVHERVGKTGNYYYSCADMKDTMTGEILDLDFDVEFSASGLDVVDVRIHKIEGNALYTYDANDNRIPL